MLKPKDIIDKLDPVQKSILTKILEVEKEYQYITNLTPQRDKEISERIIKIIEGAVKE